MFYLSLEVLEVRDTRLENEFSRDEARFDVKESCRDVRRDRREPSMVFTLSL